MEPIVLITNNEKMTFEIHIKYVLLECVRCGHSWGKAFREENQALEPSDIVCQKCNLKLKGNSI